MRWKVPILVCSLGFSAPAPCGEFGGELGLGHLAASGNTEVRSINGKFALDYESDVWKNALQAATIHASGDEGSTAERYTVSNQLDRNFPEDNYAFAVVDAERDLDGPNRTRTSQAIGYGYHALTGPTHTLDLEIGAGARQTKANLTADREDEAIARFSGKYEWKISRLSDFTQTLKVEPGESNTFTESVSELKLPIYGDLSAGLSYTYRHNSVVPQGLETVDTATAVNLSYAFGAR